MSPREQLSFTEIRIASMVWQGQTNPEIAIAVGTSEQVIKNHLRNVFDKLGVWSRVELALYVASHGGKDWPEILLLRRAPQALAAAACADASGSS